VKVVQVSRIGAREKNEDRVGHWSAPGATLLAVADGLGGHAHGEIAAQIAVNIFGTAFEAQARPRLDDPAAFLAGAIDTAHAAILHEAHKRDYADSPRTVIAACVVQDGHAYWTHIGDCRFYLVRKGRVLARTRDHTVVQRLHDEGRIREGDMATHPYRNRLLQCLGGVQQPRPEWQDAVALENGDILLLCSDGFWGPLDPPGMLRALGSRPLAEAIPALVDLAERSAGAECDNVSVVAMSWQGEEQ
jgi:serine/threonine protein phosphatase PrpC